MSTPIGKAGDFPEGESRCVALDGEQLCVARVEGKLYALGNLCSHAEAYLAEGELYAEDLEIECPLHGATFSLVDGQPQDLPATEPVTVYDIEEDGDEVVINGTR